MWVFLLMECGQCMMGPYLTIILHCVLLRTLNAKHSQQWNDLSKTMSGCCRVGRGMGSLKSAVSLLLSKLLSIRKADALCSPAATHKAPWEKSLPLKLGLLCDRRAWRAHWLEEHPWLGSKLDHQLGPALGPLDRDKHWDPLFALLI